MRDREKSTRPPDLPEPPEIERDLDRLADIADIPADGPEASDIALRNTYRVRLTEESARQLERLAEQLEDPARVAHGVPSYETHYTAAGEDLVAIGILLHYYADHAGEGIKREQIRLSAAVLDVADEAKRIGYRLMDAVAAAGGES